MRARYGDKKKVRTKWLQNFDLTFLLCSLAFSLFYSFTAFPLFHTHFHFGLAHSTKTQPSNRWPYINIFLYIAEKKKGKKKIFIYHYIRTERGRDGKKCIEKQTKRIPNFNREWNDTTGAQALILITIFSYWKYNIKRMAWHRTAPHSTANEKKSNPTSRRMKRNLKKEPKQQFLYIV